MSHTSSLPNSLDLILDLNKIKTLSAQEVEYLWISKANEEASPSTGILPRQALSTHKISSVISVDKFSTLEKLTKKNTQFILPVHNTATKQLDIHYLQWQVPKDAADNTLQLLVIKLADFQQLGAQAMPHTVVFFYKDLAGVSDQTTESLNKGLVLMKGEIIDPKAINITQLEFLILNVQKFYGVLDADNTALKNERLKLLLSFNTGDPSFDFNRLIQLAVNLK